jgi:hypothetical protein
MPDDTALLVFTNTAEVAKLADMQAAKTITQTDGELSRACGIPGTSVAVANRRVGDDSRLGACQYCGMGQRLGQRTAGSDGPSIKTLVLEPS